MVELVEIKIGDLGDVITGNTPPKKDPSNYGGDYPFIKPTDMVIDRRYVTEWDETYSQKAFEKYSKAYIPPKATGVVTIGTVGEKLFQADRHCFTNQSVNVVIPNDDYDEDYVYYLLKLNLYKVLNANPGTSSGRHHVSKSNFCSIKIDVFKNKATQQKIASILSAYDDLIENNLKRIKLLEEAAQNIYKEWFVNFRYPGHEDVPINEETRLPEGWKKVKVEDLIDIIKGKKPKVELDKPSDLSVKYLLMDVLERKTERYAENNKLRLAETGETLMLMDGSRSGVVIRSLDGAIGSTLGVLRLKKSDVGKGYCYLFFKDKQSEIRSKNTGSAIPHANKSYILSMNINIPFETISNLFEKTVGDMFEEVELLYQQNDMLKKARDILLPRLMNGMIEV